MSTPSVEIKPPAMQEMFLSPRVLDREAFEVFSSALRTLIETAAQQTADLAIAATHAENAQKRLAQQAQEIEAKIAGAQTSLQLVAAQSDDARRLMGSVEDAGLRLRTIAMATDRGIDEARVRLAHVQQAAGERLRETIDDATGKVLELEARLAQAEARLSALSADGPVSMLRAVCERAERLLHTNDPTQAPGLAELVRRAESMGDQVRASMTDLAQLRELAEGARRELAQAVLDAADKADRRDA